MAGEQQTSTRQEDRAKYRTVKNTIWGLLACLVVVFAIYGLAYRPHPEKVRAIDYSAQLAEARRLAPYDVLAPTPMPPGWQATSARAGAEPGKPFTWHLGVVTADRRYVGLEQSNGPVAAVITDKLGPVHDDGTSTVAGTPWQRKALEDRDERALIRTVNGVTTIVTGTAPYPALDQFAATLH